MRSVAANDNRGEALARAPILALLRMEAQVRSGLGPQAGASRIRRPRDMALLKPAEAAEVVDADGLKMSHEAVDVLVKRRPRCASGAGAGAG
jgi:hypothetical protein